MSTGANCVIRERKPGVWEYAMQRWPYGESDVYDTHGGFKSEQEAVDHMSLMYANPGGWSTHPYKEKK